MSKKMYEHFTELFDKNYREIGRLQEAFKKTNEDIGFTAYSSWDSYNAVRALRQKKATSSQPGHHPAQ
jgi:hypothetical protein